MAEFTELSTCLFCWRLFIFVESGIYKIINKVNGKYYVGRSKDILSESNGRWASHKRCLRNGNHYNFHLQRAWNKYGESNFEFVIVERVSESNLLESEQKYLDIAKTEKEKSYNSNYDAKGGDISEEARKKISNFRKTFRYSEESKRKISDSLTGRKLNHSHREKEVKILNLYRRTDPTIYTFVNQTSGNKFTGLKMDFVKKYNLNQGNVCLLVNKTPRFLKGNYSFIRSVRGWVVTSNTPRVDF